MPVTDVQQVARHHAAVRAIRARVEQYARSLWAGMPAYRDADIDRMVGLLLPKVAAGQRQVANLTDAYLAALLGASRVGLDLDLLTAPRGVDPEQVYRRPAIEVYAALSSGKSFDEAVANGGRRLLSIVGTDLQLSMRHQEQASLAERSQFYRRVLNGSKNCALCAIASTQRYNTGDLKPVHPGCDCGVAPIDGDLDPGRVINADVLASIHDAVEEQLGRFDPSARDLGRDKRTAGGKRISDYTDLIIVREHGEYGPTLTWRKDHFTGPDALT